MFHLKNCKSSVSLSFSFYNPEKKTPTAPPPSYLLRLLSPLYSLFIHENSFWLWPCSCTSISLGLSSSSFADKTRNSNFPNLGFLSFSIQSIVEWCSDKFWVGLLLFTFFFCSSFLYDGKWIKFHSHSDYCPIIIIFLLQIFLNYSHSDIKLFSIQTTIVKFYSPAFFSAAGIEVENCLRLKKQKLYEIIFSQYM